jgi:S-adenosylmethionine:tRNA ribosyltransferase-isomerase
VTLHVGLGTFRPVTAEKITDHKMHSEHYYMPQKSADLINTAKKNGGRVICVGTTSCRTLESVAQKKAVCAKAPAGRISLFIPGFRFQAMDGLITNFHLPESTLIMLVSALAGYDHTMNAYRTAVQEKYRFFSFGDAMFIY